MGDKLKVLGLGALEAFALGAVVGLGSVWADPKDIVLSGPGLAAAGVAGLKVGLFYFLGFLRKNTGLQ